MTDAERRTQVADAGSRIVVGSRGSGAGVVLRWAVGGGRVVGQVAFLAGARACVVVHAEAAANHRRGSHSPRESDARRPQHAIAVCGSLGITGRFHIQDAVVLVAGARHQQARIGFGIVHFRCKWP